MYLCGAALVAALPLLAHGLGSAAARFWAGFVVLLAYGPVNGVVQGSVFGLAGFLPFEYVGAVMLGNGISGIACTLLGMILVAVLPGESNLYA
jgi:hypothetical protein